MSASVSKLWVELRAFVDTAQEMLNVLSGSSLTWAAVIKHFQSEFTWIAFAKIIDNFPPAATV